MNSILFLGVSPSFSFGHHVVNAILPDLSHFSRVGVYQDTSRPASPAKTEQLARWADAGIEIISSAGYSSPEPFRGFDCVLIFLGNHGLYLQPGIIDLAIAAGVRHFYPSEYGADLMVGENQVQRYYKYKIETRDHLETRAKDVPTLGWTYFLLGRLTEWAVLPHFGFDNENATARIFGSVEGRQSLIAEKDAARYIVATLRAPLDFSREGGYRRTFRISGSSPTYGEVFNALRAATGKQYEVKYLDVEEAVIEEQEAKARGDVDAELSASHKLIQGREGTLLPGPWDNDKFPKVERPKTVVEALAVAFTVEQYKRAYGLSA